MKYGWEVAIALFAFGWLLIYVISSEPGTAVIAVFSLLLGIFLNGIKE